MSLLRSLRLRTVASTSAGLAFAAINFLACVQIADQTVPSLAWVSILTAGILCLLTAASFSELSGIYPTAAAIRVWMKHAIGENFALTVTFLYMTTVLWVIAADSFVLAHAVHAGIPQVPAIFWVFLFLTAATLANLRGVRLAGLLQDLTTFTLLGLLALVSVVFLVGHGIAWPAAAVSVAQAGPGGFLTAVALGVFIYVGFEWVTPLAEEVLDARVIPGGLFLGLGMVGVAFALFTLVLTEAVPAAKLGHTLIPQLLVGRAALGPVGFWIMLFITAVTALTTFNGGFVTASRFIYASGRERTLPGAFGRLNHRFAPHVALLAMYGVTLVLAVVVFATGKFQILIDAGAALEAFIYAVAAWCVISLRRRQPQRPRPFRFPGSPYLPGLAMVVFTVLAVASATNPVPDLPDRQVPWTLLLLLFLAAASFSYVRWVVPRLRATRPRTRRPGEVPDQPGD
ncbi:MAG: APC family permease [Thermaerobacter sp.]|nr:APC family permease [Thermaerobacter sp.]